MFFFTVKKLKNGIASVNFSFRNFFFIECNYKQRETDSLLNRKAEFSLTISVLTTNKLLSICFVTYMLWKEIIKLCLSILTSLEKLYSLILTNLAIYLSIWKDATPGFCKRMTAVFSRWGDVTVGISNFKTSGVTCSSDDICSEL